MIGIYDDSFVSYLRETLRCEPKIRTKNIVVRCPWCELRDKKEYNLWISTEAPIFKCFSGGCGKKGLLKQVFTVLNGTDILSRFVDEETQRNIVKQNIIEIRNKTTEVSKIHLPPLREDFFKEKSMFVKRRLKYYNVPLTNINGLIFDIETFVKQNNITVSDKIANIMPFLNNNFIGFLSKHKSVVVLRNIDPSSSFKHFKLEVQKTRFLDYYQLNSFSKESNEIVASEGIFDILTEHIFDSTGIKKDVRLYAASFSTSYNELFKSLAFHEQLFRMKIHVLSDRDIHLNFYKKIKRENNHLIESMNVYYNKTGKDFNDSPCLPVKYVI